MTQTKFSPLIHQGIQYGIASAVLNCIENGSVIIISDRTKNGLVSLIYLVAFNVVMISNLLTAFTSNNLLMNGYEESITIMFSLILNRYDVSITTNSLYTVICQCIEFIA